MRTREGLWRLDEIVKACGIAQISKEHLDQAVVEDEATSAPTADGMRATDGAEVSYRDRKNGVEVQRNLKKDIKCNVHLWGGGWNF